MDKILKFLNEGKDLILEGQEKGNCKRNEDQDKMIDSPKIIEGSSPMNEDQEIIIEGHKLSK